MSPKARHWDLRLCGERPLTVNAARKMKSPHAWANHTREVRAAWAWLAKGEKVPHLRRATITVLPLHKDKRSPQDVAACAPEAKAAIDGLVDAGVLPDDGPAHLLSVLFLQPHVCGQDGLELRITEAS